MNCIQTLIETKIQNFLAFYSKIILDITNVAKIVNINLVYPLSFLNVNLMHHHKCNNKNLEINIDLTLSNRYYSSSSLYLTHSFSGLRSKSWSHIAFSQHMFQVTSNLEEVLILSLSPIILTLLRNIDKLFSKVFLIGVFIIRLHD